MQHYAFGTTISSSSMVIVTICGDSRSDGTSRGVLRV